MVASLNVAQDWLKAGNCIVSYSDIFYQASGVESLIKECADMAITYDPNWQALWQGRFNNPLDDAETFRLDSQQNLLEIGNKTKDITEIQGQYMGLLKIAPDAWKKLLQLLDDLDSTTRNNIDMTSMLNRAILSYHLTIRAVPYMGQWGEVDSQSDLAFYQEHFGA